MCLPLFLAALELGSQRHRLLNEPFKRTQVERGYGEWLHSFVAIPRNRKSRRQAAAIFPHWVMPCGPTR